MYGASVGGDEVVRGITRGDYEREGVPQLGLIRGGHREVSRGARILLLKSPHIAATPVLSVGTRQTALISLQQMTESIGAAARVAGVNCRAAGEQRNRLRWAPIVPQGPKPWIGIVDVAGAIQVTGTVAAKAERRGHGSVAVTTCAVVSNDAVLKRSSANDAA